MPDSDQRVMRSKRYNRRGFLGVVAAGTGMVVSLFRAKSVLAAEQLHLAHLSPLPVQPNNHVVYHAAEASDFAMRGFPPKKDRRVTIDNFRDFEGTAESPEGARAAYTRWAHMHMRELFPTQVVRRNNALLRTLPVKKVNLADMLIPTLDGKKMKVADWLRRSDTDGFLVLHNGAIVWEEYFHGMREDTPHLLSSAGKPIAAGVMANLLATGKLKETGRITDYVPELKRTGYDGASVRDLLDMQSGVAWDYAAEGEKNSWPRWARAAGLQRKLPGGAANEGLYDLMMTAEDIKRQARPHGSLFYYKECDAQAMVWACEKVTGKRFADLLSEHLWSRLGTEYDAYIMNDAAGATLTWDAMSATLRDVGRWGQAYLDVLPPAQQVIPRKFIDDTLTNYDRSAIKEESFPGPRYGTPSNFAYRNFHCLYSYPGEDVLAGSGTYGQYCHIYPKRKLVFVKLSAQDSFTLEELLQYDAQDRAAFCVLADALAGKME